MQARLPPEIFEYLCRSVCWNLLPCPDLAIAGTILGTIVGRPLLKRIPERLYRKLISIIILALGLWMFTHPE